MLRLELLGKHFAFPLVVRDRRQRLVHRHRVTDPLDVPRLANDKCRRDAVLSGSRHVIFVNRLVGVGGQAVRLRQFSVGSLTATDVTFQEFFDRIQGLVTNTDDLHTLGRILFLQLNNVRHTRDTRTTPGRPKFDDVNLARSEFRNRLKLALTVVHPMLDVQFRRFRANRQRGTVRFVFVAKCGDQPQSGNTGHNSRTQHALEKVGLTHFGRSQGHKFLKSPKAKIFAHRSSFCKEQNPKKTTSTKRRATPSSDPPRIGSRSKKYRWPHGHRLTQMVSRDASAAGFFSVAPSTFVGRLKRARATQKKRGLEWSPRFSSVRSAKVALGNAFFDLPGRVDFAL